MTQLAAIFIVAAELVAGECDEAALVAGAATRLQGLQLDHVLLEHLVQDHPRGQVPDLDQVVLGGDQVLAVGCDHGVRDVTWNDSEITL